MIRIPQVRLAAPQGQRPTAPFSDVTQTPVTSDPGRDLQQMASTVANVGARLASLDVRAIEQANAGKARQAQGRIREALANQLQGEEGFLHLLGEDAVNNRVAALQKIDDELAKFNGEDAFDNDVQRQLFMQGTQADILRAKVAVQSHGAKQARVFNAATAQASYQADALEMANVGWSIELEKRLRGDVQAYAESAGIPKEQTRLIIQTQLSKGLGAHIQTLIEGGEFDEAQAALDKAYDPENKDGDKRDKLVGATRAGLVTKLTNAKDRELKIQEAEQKEIARALTRDTGQQIGANYLAVAYERNPNLGVARGEAEARIVGLLNGGKISQEEAQIAFGAISVQVVGFKQEDDERSAASIQALREYAGAATSATMDDFNGSFAVTNPEAYAYLNSTAAGQDVMLATAIKTAKGLMAEEAAAQKAFKAQTESEYRIFTDERAFPDDQFTEKFPGNSAGYAALLVFASPLSDAQAKELRGRWADIHDNKEPEFADDRLYRSTKTQIEDALKPFSWALIEEDNGTVAVNPEVLEDIQDAWEVYQRDVLKKEPGKTANKREFKEWFDGVAKAETEDMFNAGGKDNIQMSRQMLRIIGGAATDQSITRVIDGNTYARGSATATTVGGINTSALDVIANLRSGIELPGNRDKLAPLSPVDMRNAERLFVKLGRPNIDELLDPKRRDEFRNRILEIEGGRSMSYGTASQLVNPRVKDLYEATVDKQGNQQLGRNEMLVKLKQQVELEVDMRPVEMDVASDQDREAERQVAVDRLMSERTVDLNRLFTATPLWERWQALLKREREGLLGLGILPASGTSPYGWSSRDPSRPVWRFPYRNFADFRRQVGKN